MSKKGPLREDIATAAREMDAPRWMHGKSLRRLEPKLIDGESVLAMCGANSKRTSWSDRTPQRAGLLVRTTHRILFTSESWSGQAMETVALERVSAVQWSRRGGQMTAGTLLVHTPERQLKFILVPQGFASALQAATA